MNALIQNLLAQADTIILGKSQTIKLALACLLARGHLLIEDLPGMGKTTLAHYLARALGLDFQRIQFTSDLLPADVLGISVYERERGEFKFHPGPIFAQVVVLADEVNRATPKAQSALLEAMEERQVTVDGTTHALPQPFFVIATQNPSHQIGTYPLPESQLDRFLMRVEMGYPNVDAERALLLGEDRRNMVANLSSLATLDNLLHWQAQVTQVHAANALIAYIQAILNYTRESQRYRNGLSPRAGLGLLRAAQAWAFIHQREAVIPEDVQAVTPSIAAHRLQYINDQRSSPRQMTEDLLKSVPIP
jgi:MoxR-like ATPase